MLLGHLKKWVTHYRFESIKGRLSFQKRAPGNQLILSNLGMSFLELSLPPAEASIQTQSKAAKLLLKILADHCIMHTMLVFQACRM